MKTKTPSIYAFSNYREYLAAFIAVHQEGGESLRALSRRCGISSPNYLQQVLRGQRNLSRHFAAKFAAGAKLGALPAEYLGALVDLELAPTDRDRQRALDDMRRILRRAERRTVRDEGIHGSWVHQVVWEAAKTRGFSTDVAAIRALLRLAATEAEIEASLAYLHGRGFLARALPSETPTPVPVDFQPSNDVRRVDLQRSHLRFLQLAQHRLNDPLGEREYQGLTAAIKRTDFEAIRQRCRDFVLGLNRDFAVDAQGDEVVRVQLCAFKLTAKGD